MKATDSRGSGERLSIIVTNLESTRYAKAGGASITLSGDDKRG
jgi:hypothetical protein